MQQNYSSASGCKSTYVSPLWPHGHSGGQKGMTLTVSRIIPSIGCVYPSSREKRNLSIECVRDVGGVVLSSFPAPLPLPFLMKSALGRQRQDPVSLRTTPHEIPSFVWVLFSMKYLGSSAFAIESTSGTQGEGSRVTRTPIANYSASTWHTALPCLPLSLESSTPDPILTLSLSLSLSLSLANSFSPEDATPAALTASIIIRRRQKM